MEDSNSANSAKKTYSGNKTTIAACVLIVALAVCSWVLSSPATTSIGENISVGGTLAVGGSVDSQVKLQSNPPESAEGLRIVSASNYSPLNIRNSANTSDIFRVNQSGSLEVGQIPWARLTSFPSACSANQYVTAVGGTLTCDTPSGGAPTNATYITQTSNATLTAEQALSALATGYLKVTTTTGVVSSQAVPIPVADGGTGRTSLTTGNVLFGASPVGLSSNLFWDNTNTRLGIGTASPTNILSLGNTAAQKFWIENTAAGTVGRALTVAAGGTVAGGTNITGGNLILQAGLGTGTGASTISFQTGTTLGSGTTLQTMSTNMTILGSGNVGIGTVVPGYKLDISDTGETAMIRIENKNAAAKYTGLRLDRNTTAEKWFIGMNSTDDKLRFRSGGTTDVVVIDSAGTGSIQLGTSTTAGNVLTADSSGVGTWQAASGGFGKYVGVTTTTYNGNQGGYTGAKALCNAAYSGSHVCTTEEILYTINSGSSFPANTTAWISNGPPGYKVNANDCIGWTSSSGTNDYGTLWIKLASGDGFGGLDKCNLTYKFACCK